MFTAFPSIRRPFNGVVSTDFRPAKGGSSAVNTNATFSCYWCDSSIARKIFVFSLRRSGPSIPAGSPLLLENETKPIPRMCGVWRMILRFRMSLRRT